MSSHKEYVAFVLEQLGSEEDVSSRPMMGEYLVYYRGKYVGADCDDRFLVKPTPGAKALLPQAPMELPYEGAKEMILVEDLENRDLMNQLAETLFEELPFPKKRTRKK